MTIAVTPDPLEVPGPAQVCISGSSHPNETVTVNIDDGEGHTSSVQIALDGSGNGCADWTVPNWEQAKFNYSSCSEVTVEINNAPPGGG